MIVLPLTLGGMLFVLAVRFGRPGIRRLAANPLRGGPLVMAGCLMQLAAVATGQHRLAWTLLGAVPLLAFCWINRRRAGMVLATTGVALNLTAMAANGGTMPLRPEALAQMTGITVPAESLIGRTKNRVLDDEAATFAWLGDRLVLPGPMRRLAVWSIGDFVLLLGVWRFLRHTMQGEDDGNRTFWMAATPSGARAADLRRDEQRAFRDAARRRA